jgi:hypothetical protein
MRFPSCKFLMRCSPGSAAVAFPQEEALSADLPWIPLQVNPTRSSLHQVINLKFVVTPNP